METRDATCSHLGKISRFASKVGQLGVRQERTFKGTLFLPAGWIDARRTTPSELPCAHQVHVHAPDLCAHMRMSQPAWMPGFMLLERTARMSRYR